MNSTVVEKFIRVIESSSNSKIEVTKLPNSEVARDTREDIRRKLAFNKPDPSSEAKAKSNKKNDLEGCLKDISILHNTHSLKKDHTR